MQEKAHYIAVTVIIERDGRYLICKRSPEETVYPGKWCVPGGKLEQSDFIDTPKDTSFHWLGLLEKTASKEVLEETGLLIDDIRYVSSLAFLRPNGFSTVVISMSARWVGGEVVLQDDELVDSAWVSVDELDSFDLIENIPEQIRLVDARR